MLSLRCLAAFFLASFAATLVADEPPSAAALSKANLLAPKAFRAAARKVYPALVSIESFGGVSSGATAGVSLPGDGPTTGLVVSTDGYIVTSTFNFLKRPPVITVVFQDGKRHVARLLGRDETRKLCLLKVDGVENLPVPQFVPREELKVGQWAVAVGVGYGDSNPALSAGIISATSRISGRAVQTDANTSPANYGGPLVDLDGRVIGICVPLSPGSKEVAAGVEWYDSGIAFAVPLHGAEQLLAALKEGKTLVGGQLGIQPKPADPSGGGVAVAKVQKDSPAEKSGLKEGDVILTLEGESVLDATHLRALLGRYYAGDKIKLRLKRGAEEIDAEAELAVLPDPPPMPMPKVEAKPQKPGDGEPKKEEPKKDEPKPDEPKKDEPKPPESPSEKPE